MGSGLWKHFTLLAVAVGASLFVWTRDKTPAASPGDVTIWSARAADVERVVLESKGRKISLEARNDAQGRWFLGTSATTEAADAGAPPPKGVTFVSVAQADKLTRAIAPLRGVREIGKIGDDRASEFGMKEPEGTLTAVIAGKERKLVLGGQAPGGGSRYVRDEASGLVYAVKADVLRDLQSGESSLIEREMHEFKDSDVKSVRVVAGGKKRVVLRRGPESKRIWADPSDPEKADETIANWMAKMDRLRPVEYLGAQPAAPELVVRLEYEVSGVGGAFFEVAKVPGAPAASPVHDESAPAAAKADFLVRSERTRLWAKAYGPVGEQVEQDMASVLK